MNNYRYLQVLVSTAALLIAPLSHAGNAGTSGFIDDYPDLVADKARKGALIWRKPGMDLSAYSKIFIDPILIWYHPNAKYKGIDPGELKELTDTFRQTLVAALEPDFPVVSRAGKGVLRVRLAITNVETKKKKRGVLGYIPVAAVAGAVTGKYRTIHLADATIEAELMDGMTGERQGVLVDRLSDSAPKKKKEATSWDEVQTTLSYYAKRFRARMDRAHRTK